MFLVKIVANASLNMHFKYAKFGPLLDSFLKKQIFWWSINNRKILPYLENTLKLDEKYESSNFGFC